MEFCHIVQKLLLETRVEFLSWRFFSLLIFFQVMVMTLNFEAFKIPAFTLWRRASCLLWICIDFLEFYSRGQNAFFEVKNNCQQGCKSLWWFQFNLNSNRTRIVLESYYSNRTRIVLDFNSIQNSIWPLNNVKCISELKNPSNFCQINVKRVANQWCNRSRDHREYRWWWR